MNNTILITGCTKGIGLAIAKHLNSLGYNLVGISRSKPPENSFPSSLYLLDLSHADETQAIFNTIKQNHKIDGIINNVGNVIPQF